MRLQSPFTLLRQAVALAKFEDRETRERANNLVDALEKEADNIELEFDQPYTLTARKDLQEHIKELLSSVPIFEDDTIIEEKEVRSVGEITNEDSD